MKNSQLTSGDITIICEKRRTNYFFLNVPIETGCGSRSALKVRIQGANRTQWYTTPEKTPRRGKEKSETCLPLIKLVLLN